MPLTAQHAKNLTIGVMTGTITVFNSLGATTTDLATNLVRPDDWNSAHNVTLSVAESEMFTNGFFEPFNPAQTNSTLSTVGVGTWYLDQFVLPAQIGSGQINLFGADAAGFLNGAVISAASTGSVTLYQTMSTKLAIYQRGSSDSSSRLDTVWTGGIEMRATWERRIGTTATSALTVSNYLSLSFPAQYDASGGVTYSTTAQSGTLSVGASTMVSTSMNTLITGAVAYVSGSKMLPVGFNTQLPAGDYRFAMMISSSSSSTGTNYSTGTMWSTQSVLGQLEIVTNAYKRVGLSVSNASTAAVPYHGSVATTSTSPISPLRTSDMRNFATAHRRVWNYLQSSY